jgi:hypothetical protein
LDTCLRIEIVNGQDNVPVEGDPAREQMRLDSRLNAPPIPPEEVTHSLLVHEVLTDKVLYGRPVELDSNGGAVDNDHQLQGGVRLDGNLGPGERESH